MKNRILNAGGVLISGAIWFAFVVYVLCSCNSSKKLHSETSNADSTAVHDSTSTAVSSTHSEDRFLNESILEMMFGLQASVDSLGRPVNKVYPTKVTVIDRNSGEKINDKHDSIFVATHDSTNDKLLQQLLDKQNSTKVMPGWQLWAMIGGAFLFGLVTRYFKIQRR